MWDHHQAHSVQTMKWSMAKGKLALCVSGLCAGLVFCASFYRTYPFLGGNSDQKPANVAMPTFETQKLLSVADLPRPRVKPERRHESRAKATRALRLPEEPTPPPQSPEQPSEKPTVPNPEPEKPTFLNNKGHSSDP
jgi:hypothetical protein